MKHIHIILCLLIVACYLTCPAQTQSNPWVALTLLDLQGVHDIMRDNHPGPVDPENARYAKWLEEGLKQSSERAQSVHSYSEYARVLRFYTNGFQDGHLGAVLDVVPEDVRWPGFIVASDDRGEPQIVYAEPNSGVKVGEHLISCDGRSIDDLMKERVDPYYWNSAIPHQRPQLFHYLFDVDPRDPEFRLKTCRFTSGETNLIWRRTDRRGFEKTLATALGLVQGELSIAQVNGVWLIKVPTLAFMGEANVKKVRDFLATLRSKAAELRSATVVFDVRGNHGGDSSWSEEIAAVLWGPAWIKYVEDGFDGTTDWRASPANIKWMEYMVTRQQNAGLTDSANYDRHVVEAMKSAAAAGKPLARMNNPPKLGTRPAENPITGHVYFLTDNACASACLNFADLMRRLPGVTHVGLPTSADAIYIDNTTADLPSGLGVLGYSLKVNRHHVRGNNEWYEPQVRWPGGVMTDDTITKWVASLAPGPARSQ